MATSYTDQGLIRGSVSVTINSVAYLLKEATRNKPVRREVEYDGDGLPLASSTIRDFETISGTIMAYTGTAEPAQMVAFTYDSKSWIVGNLSLSFSTAGLQGYSVELHEVLP